MFIARWNTFLSKLSSSDRYGKFYRSQTRILYFRFTCDPEPLSDPAQHRLRAVLAASPLSEVRHHRHQNPTNCDFAKWFWRGFCDDPSERESHPATGPGPRSVCTCVCACVSLCLSGCVCMCACVRFVLYVNSLHHLMGSVFTSLDELYARGVGSLYR